MKKPAQLRAHLLQNVPHLARSPELLTLSIEGGSVRSTASAELGFEYRYRVVMLLTDYSGSPDAIIAPVLVWLRMHQQELFAVTEQLTFEVEFLDSEKVDFQIVIPLTERVVVQREGDGWRYDYPAEPLIEPGTELVELLFERGRCDCC